MVLAKCSHILTNSSLIFFIEFLKQFLRFFLTDRSNFGQTTKNFMKTIVFLVLCPNVDIFDLGGLISDSEIAMK